MSLTAIALNCSLKSSLEESSTEVLLKEALSQLKALGVEAKDPVRVVDLNIKPGVTTNEGDGDAWPLLRKQILDADILLLGTPIWMGQPGSVVKRVLERMDALLGDADESGRLPTYGKVAIVAVVGNEDGAHHVSAELFQALNDVGFTIPAAAVTYWVGEAMQSVDYKDKSPKPEKTQKTTSTAARHAVHLARLLQSSAYPAGS